jgi:hypothetical protein
VGTSVLGIVGGVVGAGASIFGSVKSSKAAGSASDSQSDLAQAQADIARAQWKRYVEAYEPIENKLLAEAQQPTREAPGFLSMVGGINRNYADSSANLRRMMGGAYPSGAGESLGQQRSLYLNRTRDLGRTETGWENQRLANMMNVASIGRNLPANATAGLQGAASTYGDLARMYGGLSGQGFGGVGQGLGNMLQMYALSNRNSTGGPTRYQYGWDQTWPGETVVNMNTGPSMQDTYPAGYGYWD